MPADQCPRCKETTFFEQLNGRKCRRCGYTMIVPVNGGRSGKGKKCAVCGHFTVFDAKCSECGAKSSDSESW
jgi:hypothetical protein